MSRLSITKEPEVVVQNTEPFILTSESFEDYSNSFKYIEALYEEVNNQHELNRYMSECLILAENSTPYVKMQKLKALNEEDTLSIGDKSSSNTGWFDKIINFIKKIWGKFVEKITRWITTNNYYLEKYKDIILKKEPKIGNIQFDGSPCNFEWALDRIYKDNIIELGNLADIEGVKNLPAKGTDANEKTQLAAMASKICPNLGKMYGSNNPTDENFATWCAEYFEGKHPAGNIKNEIVPADLNWTNMYNFCHDANNLKSVLDKDKETVFKVTTAFTEGLKKLLNTYKNASDPDRTTMRNDLNTVAKTMNFNIQMDDNEKTEFASDIAALNKLDDEAKAAEGKAKSAPQDTAAQTDAKNKRAEFNTAQQKLAAKVQAARANKSKEQKDQHAAEIDKRNSEQAVNTNESVWISALDNTYIVTEDGVSVSQAVKQNTQTANANAQINQVKNLGAAANNGVNAMGLKGGETKDQMDEMIKEVEGKGQFYVTTAQNILTGKITAVEFIYSQFMKIIRAHVESYIGVTSADGNKVANTATNRTVNAQQGPQYTLNTGNPQPQPQPQPPVQ